MVGDRCVAGVIPASLPEKVSSMPRRPFSSFLQTNLALAARALRAWTPRQIRVAVGVAAGFAILVGIVTVLIPNPWFSREIEAVWWNYPVWLLSSAGVGMLTATYVRPSSQGAAELSGAQAEQPAEQRTARMGIIGGALTWFAVGCPVCNKIALFALGYSGAITWFAPLQPVLAVAALVLTAIALVWRLRGQVACTVPSTSRRSAITRSSTATLQ